MSDGPKEGKRELRTAWTDYVRAEDYEAHMANVGQAQANAQLVEEYFRQTRLPADASVLFAGAGTGQMFDYVSPAFLRPFRVTFADINGGYLTLLNERLNKEQGLRYVIAEDDVEESTLTGSFATALAVLVLEHVDWRKAIATLSSLAERYIFAVVQENPADLSSAMTPSRTVKGTMAIFKEVHPELIPRGLLKHELGRHGFQASFTAERSVTDGKKMVGLGFTRSGWRAEESRELP